ncbi:MAG: hypothetical protein IKS15_04540 [Opitutales bacterium]|nr:hypothetical protein [Opitutales bacterium]
MRIIKRIGFFTLSLFLRIILAPIVAICYVLSAVSETATIIAMVILVNLEELKNPDDDFFEPKN